MKICLATNNQGKIKELKSLLSSLDIEVVGLKDIGCKIDLPETGTTFQENSLQKAQYVFDNYQISCIADDSGLEIDALQGEPGVFSARYAGEHGNDKANIAKVLEKLARIENRKANFKTVVTYINADGNAYFFEGKIEGKIAHHEMGTNGFGYDPIFIPKGYSETFAEFSAEIKNRISHRAKAVIGLLEFLKMK